MVSSSEQILLGLAIFTQRRLLLVDWFAHLNCHTYILGAALGR